MQELIEWLKSLSQGGLSDLHIKILLTILILLSIWVVKRISAQSIRKIQSSPQARYSWIKASNYIANILAFMGIGFMWSDLFGSFVTFLGLLSAGLAIAFKDPIVNMAGWYFIVFRRPFKVGDRIQVDQHIGDVIDVALFEFKMMEVGNWVNSDQSTGRILHIPNQRVFSSVIANYNSMVDFIWNEIEVTISFESDWRKAKTILEDILKEHAPQIYEQAEKDLKERTGEYLIYYNKLTPIVYTSVSRVGVLLSMRYLCPPKQRRISMQEIWEAVLDKFSKEENIKFAYPTQRFVQDEPELEKQKKSIK